MGHVINPISQRMGYTRFWSTNWSISGAAKNINYSFIANESIYLLKYTKKILLKFLQPLFRKGWLLLNIQILRFNNLLSFIFVNQIKFINNLYRIINKVLKTMFNLKKVEFTYRMVRARTVSEKNRRSHSITKMLKYYPYTNYGRNLNVYTGLLKKHTKKLDNYFLYTTTRLPRFNLESNEPDLISYLWTSSTTLFKAKKILVSRKRFNRFDADEKVYKRNIVVEVLKTVFINRWIFLIKNYLQIALARFTYSYSKLPVEVMFVCVSNNNISANFVTKYLSTRLLQKFPIRRLMSSLLKQLKLAQQNGSIHGFKVVCNGRFARRGRASHVWKMLGKLPRANKNLFVDYSIMLPVLTNSICAVKVWLLKTMDNNKLLVI